MDRRADDPETRRALGLADLRNLTPHRDTLRPACPVRLRSDQWESVHRLAGEMRCTTGTVLRLALDVGLERWSRSSSGSCV